MRVCLICEGSYPYVQGGVSSWVQMVCNQMKDVEFVIWALATTKEEMNQYKYNLPQNVKSVNTFYLGEENFKVKKKKVHLEATERKVLENLIIGQLEHVDWKETLLFIKNHRNELDNILMSEDFYEICLEEYQRKESTKVFHQYLWNYRSMYFPVMSVLNENIPEADVYHALSTGYAGILGSCASYVENKPFILSEHGIYTREREEDIIRSNWVDSAFKKTWINFFKKLSYVAYNQANVVTSLFEVNRTLQIELGCPENKIEIIPNGVDPTAYLDLISKEETDEKRDVIRIGAIVRIVPIKDIKTMLLAFEIVKSQNPKTELIVMGNYVESPEYYEECKQLIVDMSIKDVIFTGQVNIKEYLPTIDILLLSSISEGQPLAILEGLAAGVPFVATNVGHCKGILEGEEGDEFGSAGYIVPVMNSAKMAAAIFDLIKNPIKRKEMGEAGKLRVAKYYNQKIFLDKYNELYNQLGGAKKWQE